MHIKGDDGNEADIGPGDVFTIGPGHDAWTLGKEPCVLLDFAGMVEYAKPRGEPRRAETAEARATH
jgi:hypothetical protein